MRKTLGVLFAWLVVAGASSAAPSSGAELHALCGAYLLDPRSEEAARCEAYVQGFLDGLRASMTSADQPPPAQAGPEPWSHRAARTRLGRGALSRVHDRKVCLPESATASAVIPLIVRLLDVDSTMRSASAAAAIIDSLRPHYRCD